MDKKELLARRETERAREYRTEPVGVPTRTAEYPQIKEAVVRAVQEYGETLRKLAKDD